MAIKLYKLDASPPARAAMIACELFTVPVEFVDVDLMKREHTNPDFVKKNPLHTVPVLEDGDLILHDSHAIIAYLADKYGKDDSFYPKDVTQRALVNQKLFFNNSILFPRLRNVTYPLIVEGDKNIPEKKYNDIAEAYEFLEAFLSRAKYVASDSKITIADIAVYVTSISLELLLKIDENKYPKILAWHKVMEQQPYIQKHNPGGHNELRQLLNHNISRVNNIEDLKK